MPLFLMGWCVAWCAGALAPAPHAALRLQEPVTAPEARADEDIHEQMRQIVLQIERTLKQVDDLLWDRRQARETVPVSVAARLGHARDGAKLAVEQMDKLLELAHEHPGSAGT